jgi:hypothetical protein
MDAWWKFYGWMIEGAPCGPCALCKRVAARSRTVVAARLRAGQRRRRWELRGPRAQCPDGIRLAGAECYGPSNGRAVAQIPRALNEALSNGEAGLSERRIYLDEHSNTSSYGEVLSKIELGRWRYSAVELEANYGDQFAR